MSSIKHNIKSELLRQLELKIQDISNVITLLQKVVTQIRKVVQVINMKPVEPKFKLKLTNYPNSLLMSKDKKITYQLSILAVYII